MSGNVMMIVPERTGKFPYASTTMSFTCDLVRNLLADRVHDELTMEEKIAHLKCVFEGLYELILPGAFEDVFAGLSTSSKGLKWEVAPLQGGPDTTFTPFILTLKSEGTRSECTLWKDMKEKVLYRPTLNNFPFLDFVWKKDNKTAVMVQVTRAEEHQVSFSAYETAIHTHLQIPDTVRSLLSPHSR